MNSSILKTTSCKGVRMSGAGDMHDAGQAKILVVDDLPEKHLAYEVVLEGLGPEIVSVTSGAEALKEVLRDDFAVILLDVNMPGMDGFETARLIRQRRRSAATPIIFLTAFADEVRTAQGYAMGAVDYLPTPIVPGILRAKVRVFVELFNLRRQMARQAEEKAKQAATEDANRRLSFLADAGALLGRSLDIEATARDIVRIPVPLLANVSILQLSSIVGKRNSLLVAREDASGQVEVKEFDGNDSLSSEVVRQMNRVMVTANYELTATGPSNATPSSVVLPLQARERILGAMALTMESPRRAIQPSDIPLAEAFASRAAIALDNALLHEEIRLADRQKNDFLSMLAHELRNPLAPIRNASQLLSRFVPNEPDVKWACDVIDRQVVQLVRLVDDLLDVARITRDKIQLQRERIELASVMERAVEASRPVIDARQHHLHLSLSEAPLWISGDMIRLTQVLTNLLNNAAKYTDEGGEIWLNTGKDERFAVIRVRDSGIGIPQHMLESVFELFMQVDRALDRSSGGLGIGLTLVKRLIEMHDGTVEAHSDGLGRGSEFVINLPLINTEAADPSENHQMEDSPQRSASHQILVVDDNRDSARTLSMMLRMLGHETMIACDGLEAVQAAEEYKPDLILLDIGLPKLNGYEVCRKIRQQPGGDGILIVALTGWGQDEDRFRSAEAGFDEHLVKPTDLKALQELLSNQKLSKI